MAGRQRGNGSGSITKVTDSKKRTIELESSFQKSIKPKWSYNAVLRILKNEVYTGTPHIRYKCRHSDSLVI